MEITYDKTVEVHEIGLEGTDTKAVVRHNLEEESLQVEVDNCNGKQPAVVLREVADALDPLKSDERQQSDIAPIEPSEQSPTSADTPHPSTSKPESSQDSPSADPDSSDTPRDTTSKDEADRPASDHKPSEDKPGSSETQPSSPEEKRSKRSAAPTPEDGSPKTSETEEPAVKPLKLSSSKGSSEPTPPEDSPTSKQPTSQPEKPVSEQPDTTHSSKETSEPEPESTRKATNLPTPPMGLTAAQLKDWLEKNLQGEPAPSPNGPLKHIQVVSWMQVPQILKEIESSSSQIRVTFPEIIPADKELTTEQEEVRNFLSNHAGSAMKDISSALEEKIASCVLFRRQSPAFNAKEYVSQFELDMKNSEKLHVCEVVRVTDDFKPTKAGDANMRKHHIKGRDVILSTIEEGLGKTNEYRSFVIEVTTQNKDIFRQELHKRYNELPEPKADTTKTKIWVADSFTVAASRVKEYEFLAFIGEETPTPAPAPRKEEEPEGKSTQPKDETPRKSTEEKPSPDPSPKAKRAGSKIESLTLGMA